MHTLTVDFTEDVSTLTVTLPAELHQEINCKAWSMLPGVLDLLREHMAQQILCGAVGDGGTLDCDRANAIIAQCELTLASQLDMATQTDS